MLLVKGRERNLRNEKHNRPALTQSARLDLDDWISLLGVQIDLHGALRRELPHGRGAKEAYVTLRDNNFSTAPWKKGTSPFCN